MKHCNNLTQTMRRLPTLCCLLLLCLLTAGTARAQKSYQENAKLKAIFEELNEKFPQTYLIRRTNDWVVYDLNYWFKSGSDRQTHRKMFDRMFAELDQLKPIRKYVEVIDEADKQYTKYTFTLPSERKGQTDFVQMEVGNNKVSFQYKVNVGDNCERLPISRQKAQEARQELDKLWEEYAAMRGTSTQAVSYDWNRRNYRRCIATDQSTKVAQGTKHLVPGRSRKDYDRICARLRQLQEKYNLFMATNDVFWEYEEAAVAFHDAGSRLTHYGVALKNDGTLCLIKTTCGSLPRCWAEDSAVWDDNLRLRPHYRTPDNPK